MASVTEVYPHFSLNSIDPILSFVNNPNKNMLVFKHKIHNNVQIYFCIINFCILWSLNSSIQKLYKFIHCSSMDQIYEFSLQIQIQILFKVRV